MNFAKAEFIRSAASPEQFLRDGLPQFAFAGRSNVGKSSLLNRLVNRKALARVSATPGKTATINFYRLMDCRFVDLPGYGYAKVSKSEKERWASLVEGYFAQQRQIALVIQLIDMRHKPSANDLQMIDFLQGMGAPFAVVCTKSDKLNKGETTAQTQLFSDLLAPSGIPFYPFSAVKGAGLEEVRELIAKAVETYAGM